MSRKPFVYVTILKLTNHINFIAKNYLLYVFALAIICDDQLYINKKWHLFVGA